MTSAAPSEPTSQIAFPPNSSLKGRRTARWHELTSPSTESCPVGHAHHPNNSSSADVHILDSARLTFAIITPLTTLRVFHLLKIVICLHCSSENCVSVVKSFISQLDSTSYAAIATSSPRVLGLLSEKQPLLSPCRMDFPRLGRASTRQTPCM
jgi:hypothetical protein